MATRYEGSNLIFLTLYVIGVSYTFNRMIDSIDDKVKYESDKGAINDQLKEQGFQDDISVSFKLSPSYDIDQLKELIVIIQNKSNNLAVYVDWDNCTFVDEYNQLSRRVIRKSPDVTRDLGVPQTPSLIAPTKTMVSLVTAEDVFELDQVSGTYKANKPLIDINALKKSPLKVKRILYKDFIDRKKNLDFSLQLVFRVSELRVGLTPGENKPPICIVNCPFTIRKLPWTYALPWNKKRG